jgi:hypothetical protein
MTRFAALLSLVLVAPGLADDKPLEPFNGKDLTGWKFRGDAKKNKWTVGIAALDQENPDQLRLGMGAVPKGRARHLVNLKPGVDILTEDAYGDVHLELEFMIPKGANSGVYLMGEYEVQIYDTHGKKPIENVDMASIYRVAAPSEDASKKFGEWQKLVIDFEAPKFEDGKKVAHAKFVKVEFNGTVIHENVECTRGVTPGGLAGKEAAEGPLLFQGDHGAVAFRNIKITPVK